MPIDLTTEDVLEALEEVLRLARVGLRHEEKHGRDSGDDDDFVTEDGLTSADLMELMLAEKQNKQADEQAETAAIIQAMQREREDAARGR